MFLFIKKDNNITIYKYVYYHPYLLREKFYPENYEDFNIQNDKFITTYLPIEMIINMIDVILTI